MARLVPRAVGVERQIVEPARDQHLTLRVVDVGDGGADRRAVLQRQRHDLLEPDGARRRLAARRSAELGGVDAHGRRGGGEHEEDDAYTSHGCPLQRALCQTQAPEMTRGRVARVTACGTRRPISGQPNDCEKPF
jgi:hypothetical protein